MPKFYYDFLRFCISNFAKVVGPIHAPWTHRKIKYSDIREAYSCLKIGDIILTRTFGEASTLIIPGFWKHAAIYVGEGRIIDATQQGVRYRYLEDLLMTTDNLVIMRCVKITPQLALEMRQYALKQVGKAYDFKILLHDTVEFFCSELVMAAINHTLLEDFIESRERSGLLTFTPDDCYKATSKFNIILEKRYK